MISSRLQEKLQSHIYVQYNIYNCVLLLLVLVFTAIDFSLGGSSPYTSTDKTNKNKCT